MSRWSFDARSRAPPPDAAVEIAARACRRGGRRDGAAAQTVVSAHAVEPLPEGARGAVADRRRTSAIVALVGGAVGARARQHRPAAAHRARRAGSGREGVARPLRAGAGARAGPRPADPLAGPESGAVPDRGRAGELRRRPASCPTAGVRGRWREAGGRRASTKGCVPRPAPMPASSTSRRSTSSTPCSAARRAGRPATGCSSTSTRPTSPRSRSFAAADLIFFRTRGADGGGHAGRSRPSDGDVLRGSPAGRRLRAGGHLRRARRTDDESGAASSSGCRLAVENVDVRAAAALTDRITAAPELLDALAPLVGLLLRDGEKAA